MRNSFSEHLRQFVFSEIPLLSSLLLMFVFFVPVSSEQLDYFRPSAGFICVYYWSLKRRDAFGYLSAFTVGFFSDVYSSSPLGINILLMLSVVAATGRLERYFRNSSFGAEWFVFTFTAVFFLIFKWLLLTVYEGSLLSFTEACFGCLSTVMFYPFFSWLNGKIKNRFLPSEYADE